MAEGMTKEEVARACHEIVDAASALMVDVDFLLSAPVEQRQPAADNARESIARIVRLANAIRAAWVDPRAQGGG